MAAKYQRFTDGGFFALGGAPSPESPRDWLAWHFTHESNVPAILSAGALLPSSAAHTVTNVGQLSIKESRKSRSVKPHNGYPSSTVADHVPLYFAAKSPMLYKVCQGHADYAGGPEPLVFLGFRVGDIVDSGCNWCASNANAATSWANLTCSVNGLGSFVDFNLLQAKMWKNIPDDPMRASKRAAELLVLNMLPIGLVRLVVTQNQHALTNIKKLFQNAGLTPDILALPDMYYYR